MKLNPILKRDIVVGSRSTRLSVLVMTVNAVLFSVGLLGLFGRLSAFRLEQTFQYRSSFTVYAVVVSSLFLLVLFLYPAFTVGSISGEVHGGTLDLMLTSGLRPAKIVTGKFLGSLFSGLVLLFSCLPAMLLPLVFGGIGFTDCLKLLLLFVPLTVLLLSIGLFSSAAGKNSQMSSLIAYSTVLGLTVLPLLLPLLTASLNREGENRLAYMAVLSPLMSVGTELLRQIEEDQWLQKLFRLMGMELSSELGEALLPANLLLELFLSVLFLWLAVRKTSPITGSR